MSETTLGEQIIARVENPEHRARLAAMVPDPRVADAYVRRTLPGGRTEDEVYRRAITVQKPVLLFGGAGSGKTLSPFAWAAENGMPVAVIEGHNGFDPETVWMDREQNPETGMWERTEADIVLVWMYGGVGIADEIGRIPPRQQSSLLPLFDDRRRITLPTKQSIKQADNVLIVGTTNPPTYAGVQQMDPALWDRFSPVMKWDYSDEVERAVLDSAELRKMAKNVRDRGTFDTPMSTRQLVEFESTVQDMGWSFARAVLIARYSEYEQLEIKTVLDNHGPRIAEELGVEYDS